MINSTKTFNVLNKIQSPFSCETKIGSFVLWGGTSEHPYRLPLTIEEIRAINNVTNAFRIGRIWFDEADAKAIYADLRIADWEDILTDEQIEDIITRLDLEGFKKILAIRDEGYFERIRGVYIGMKNAGISISSKADNIIKARHEEFRKKQRTTKIIISEQDISQNAVKPKEVDALRAEIEMMKKLLAEFANSEKATPETAKDESEPEAKPETPASAKKATTAKKTATAKKAITTKKATESSEK